MNSITGLHVRLWFVCQLSSAKQLQQRETTKFCLFERKLRSVHFYLEWLFHSFRDKPETVVSKLINVLRKCDFWDQFFLQIPQKKL